MLDFHGSALPYPNDLPRFVLTIEQADVLHALSFFSSALAAEAGTPLLIVPPFDCFRVLVGQHEEWIASDIGDGVHVCDSVGCAEMWGSAPTVIHVVSRKSTHFARDTDEIDHFID